MGYCPRRQPQRGRNAKNKLTETQRKWRQRRKRLQQWNCLGVNLIERKRKKRTDNSKFCFLPVSSGFQHLLPMFFLHVLSELCSFTVNAFLLWGIQLSQETTTIWLAVSKILNCLYAYDNIENPVTDQHYLNMYTPCSRLNISSLTDKFQLLKSDAYM